MAVEESRVCESEAAYDSEVDTGLRTRGIEVSSEDQVSSEEAEHSECENEIRMGGSSLVLLGVEHDVA